MWYIWQPVALATNCFICTGRKDCAFRNRGCNIPPDILFYVQERQKYWDEQSKFYSEDEPEEESAAATSAATAATSGV